MNKLFLTLFGLLALLTSRPTDAQTVFAPPGAEWWYEWGGLIAPPQPFTHVQSVGDSLVGGQLARKLLVEYVADTGAGYFATYEATYLVRTSGDDVLSWDPAAGAYRLEYRFSRVAGDTWSHPGCTPGDSVDYVIDSATVVTVGHTGLRQQYSSDTSTQQFVALERVGRRYGGLVNPLMFPRPWCGGIPEIGAALVYYNDAAVRIGTTPVLHLAEPHPVARLSVSPNPAPSGRFRCEGLFAETVTYGVMDAIGRPIARGQLTAASPEINLSAQPAGLYLLHGECQGKTFTRRLIRE